MVDYSYAYLIGALIFGIPWLYIYIVRPDIRREQLTLSTLLCLAGLTEHFFYGEYWTPSFIWQFPNIKSGIESIILCFFYGGIASTLYEVVFHERLRKIRSKKDFDFAHGLLYSIFSLLLGMVLWVVLWKAFAINIIYSISIGMVLMGICLILFRRDLLKPSLLNGLSVAVLSWVILVIYQYMFPGIIEKWWILDQLSGIRIIGVPIEELIWHFALGFAFGGVYEVMLGFLDYKSPNRRK